jgi:uncharacterized protein YcbX
VRVSSIHIYPVKSGYRVDEPAAEVEPWGLAGDRRWLVVGPSYVLVTQREVAALGRIRPSYESSGGLVLRAHRAVDLRVPVPGPGELVEVKVWDDSVLATPAGPEADRWVSEVVGVDTRLVYLDDPTRRPVNPAYGRPDDRVSFADAYPVLLTNAASLAAVNDWLAEAGEEPVPMTRFRPNLVVDGAPAWAEDSWVGRRLRAGDAVFRAVKPCDRCVLTTIDPETGEKGREPLRVLGWYRRFPEGLLFGLNLVPDGRGRVAVGDPVTIEVVV